MFVYQNQHYEDENEEEEEEENPFGTNAIGL